MNTYLLCFGPISVAQALLFTLVARRARFQQAVSQNMDRNSDLWLELVKDQTPTSQQEGWKDGPAEEGFHSDSCQVVDDNCIDCDAYYSYDR